MKKLLLITGFFFSALGANAQNQGDIGLDFYGGYTFGDKIYNNSSYVEIQDAFQYGAGLEFYVRNTKSIELKYLRMDTKTPIYAPTVANPLQITQANVGNDSSAINYILIAGNNYFQTSNPSLVPFAGLGIGVGWASGDQSTSARFAWDVKAGVKIKASDVVSVKLQAYFQTIWGSYGSETYYYPGWGTVTYPNNSSLYQFGLGAALAFDFKH
ncbi:MAG: hypothetical protein H7Y10_06440 [Flavobacterium sp.]|nr:hypothetical protein [Flavobacterium sp.]